MVKNNSKALQAKGRGHNSLKWIESGQIFQNYTFSKLLEGKNQLDRAVFVMFLRFSKNHIFVPWKSIFTQFHSEKVEN